MNSTNTGIAVEEARAGHNQPSGVSPAEFKRKLIHTGLYAGVVSLAFFPVLLQLVRAALGSDLYSYILMIPVMTAYLVRMHAAELPKRLAGPSPWAWAFIGGGLLLLAVRGLAWQMGLKLGLNDRLAIGTLSWLAFLTAGGLHFLGGRVIQSIRMPLCLLVFMAPMPAGVEAGLEWFFQHASAEVTAWMLAISGTPHLRDGLAFQLPNISIQVAPECSGIRSSLVLLITSFLAGYLFLSDRRHRLLVILSVVPIAIARNAFRIFVISMLCVHLDPSWIRSWVHKQGGPIFFALSLIPFFAFILWLRRRECRLAEKKRPSGI